MREYRTRTRDGVAFVVDTNAPDYLALARASTPIRCEWTRVPESPLIVTCAVCQTSLNFHQSYRACTGPALTGERVDMED